MWHYRLLFITLLGLLSSLPTWSGAAQAKVLVGHLSAVDAKKKTVVIDGQLYKLRPGAKISVAGKQIAVSDLHPDKKVHYITHKNQRTGAIEIKAMAILLL